MGSVVLNFSDPLFLVIAGLLLYCFLKDPDPLVFVAVSIAPLILTVQHLSYWGFFPFNSYLYWFWGLPFVLLAVPIAIFFSRRANLYVYFPITLGILIILNQIFLLNNSEIPIKIVGPTSSNIQRNLPDDASVINFLDAYQIIERGGDSAKWIVEARSSPLLNDQFIKAHVKKGEYWVFGEHDNLGFFLRKGSYFNEDSYQRQRPWYVNRPIMVRSLFIAANEDPIYTSNIGCTLKQSIWGYPLIWEYNAIGIPKILGFGEYNQRYRVTLLGDSDPIVKFLVSFNTNFLQALFNQVNFTDIAKGLVIILITILLFINQPFFSPRLMLITAIFFGFLLVFLYPRYQYALKSPVDVTVYSSDIWLSPHLESHFSYLPKSLSEKNLTVAINDLQRKSGFSIYIVNSGHRMVKDFKNDNSPKRLIIMLPLAVIKDGQKSISVQDIPLGIRRASLFGENIEISDARNLEVNGVLKDCIYNLDKNTTIIATNSPQHIQGFEEILNVDKH